MIGVLGGSGIYAIDGLQNARWKRVESPFGEPSDELLFGEIDGAEVVFLPRHGRGHRHSPTTLNYRANIDALKRSGVTTIVSLSAVGSLREDLPPGTFVLVDQFIDRTRQRAGTFFDSGVAAHVDLARPVCARLASLITQAAEAGNDPIRRGGTCAGETSPARRALSLSAP